MAYRTTGNFLVSYSTNLSKGGLFLETSDPLPVGPRLRLLLAVPGIEAPLEVDAKVAWERHEPTVEGHPAGMGIAFAALEEPYGEVVDRIVRSFTGIEMGIVGTPSPARTLIVH